MSFNQKDTSYSDFRKLEEKIYQFSEIRYHLLQIKLSFQEATHHLKKIQYHASLINELNENFKKENSDV
jgi:hypothetical protein